MLRIERSCTAGALAWDDMLAGVTRGSSRTGAYSDFSRSYVLNREVLYFTHASPRFVAPARLPLMHPSGSIFRFARSF